MATYPRVDSEAPAFETVPARRRPDSTGLFEMPASLKDELALLCLPDLEEVLLVGGGCSKRRENILIHYHQRRLPCLLDSPPDSAQRPEIFVDSVRNLIMGSSFSVRSVDDAMPVGDDGVTWKQQDAQCKTRTIIRDDGINNRKIRCRWSDDFLMSEVLPFKTRLRWARTRMVENFSHLISGEGGQGLIFKVGREDMGCRDA